MDMTHENADTGRPVTDVVDDVSAVNSSQLDDHWTPAAGVYVCSCVWLRFCGTR